MKYLGLSVTEIESNNRPFQSVCRCSIKYSDEDRDTIEILQCTTIVQ